MEEFIEITKWFYKESMSYMDGHSKWHIYSGMPRAYIRFIRLTYKNK